jgi:hypothetical protein
MHLRMRGTPRPHAVELNGEELFIGARPFSIPRERSRQTPNFSLLKRSLIVSVNGRRETKSRAAPLSIRVALLTGTWLWVI